MRKYIFLFAGLLLAQMSYAALDVRHFGAKGDGTTLDTRAIQSAIDSAAVCGGETVVLPPGRYLSGTLVLKNNVALHIEKGAILLGSTSLDDYPQYVSHYVSHIIRAVRLYLPKAWKTYPSVVKVLSTVKVLSKTILLPRPRRLWVLRAVLI